MSDRLQHLEQKIETERGLMDHALAQLAQALSSEQISETVAGTVKQRGNAVGDAAINAARANPAGAILVGAGLAALLAGPKRPKDAQRHAATADPQAQPAAHPSGSIAPGAVDTGAAASDPETYEPRASSMRAALLTGLANLPEPARKRVVAAREAAIDVQEKVDRQAAAAARRARRFHHRQPFSTAAIAVGLGAVIGALLPRTKLEDDTLGRQRDALLQQAELQLRDEIARAADTGEDALRDGLDAGKRRLRQH